MFLNHGDCNLTPTISSNDRLEEQEVRIHDRGHGPLTLLTVCEKTVIFVHILSG